MAKYKIVYGEISLGVGEKPLGVGDVIELDDYNGQHMVAAGNVVKLEDEPAKGGKSVSKHVSDSIGFAEPEKK